MENALYKQLKKLYSDFRKLYHYWTRPRDFSLREVKYLGSHFVVLAHEDVGWILLRRKTYEERDIKYMQQLIRSDDLCIDVGANIGIYSVIMARKASQGRVVSFEPIAINQKILALNAEINNCQNIEIMDMVVTDQEGKINFTVTKDSAYSSINTTDRNLVHEIIAKPATTLDKQFADIPEKVGGIKIDVEGAELLVLRGGKGLLADRKKRPRFVLVEVSAHNEKAYGHTPGDLLEFMGSMGYEPFSITAKGIIAGWPQEKGSENVLFLLPNTPRPTSSW